MNKIEYFYFNIYKRTDKGLKTYLNVGNDTNIQIPMFLKFEIGSTPPV